MAGKGSHQTNNPAAFKCAIFGCERQGAGWQTIDEKVVAVCAVHYTVIETQIAHDDYDPEMLAAEWEAEAWQAQFDEPDW